MSNKQAIEILDEMISYHTDNISWDNYLYDFWYTKALEEAKARIASLPSEWISADNPPEEVQMKQILAYEIDERRWIITATFYDGKWLRDDNENICFFDFWKKLPTPPIN